MIAAMLLALPALALIGIATPRQADQMLGRRFGRTGRGRIRSIGILLLVIALGIAVISPDGTRGLIGSIGVIGIEAILLALLFTLSKISRAD